MRLQSYEQATNKPSYEQAICKSWTTREQVLKHIKTIHEYEVKSFINKSQTSNVRGTLKKNPVYLKTLSKREGGRSTTFQKIKKKWFFDKSWEREGVTKHIVKNRSTLFCMIYYSIWPNQGTLSFCLYPWPSESNKENRECKFKA